MYKGFLKRFFDLIISFVLLVVLSPFILFVIVLLWFVNKGNPFFYQRRPGLNGEIFLLWKFKTMNDKKDANGELLPDNERLTAVGAFIRKISFDEIPQLLNVLLGDMSLIGPRPLLPQYLNLYSDFQKRRHEVKPGITGWAQVNGRNAISWTKKFEYDVWYVNHLNWRVDCMIVVKTVQKILMQSDINQSENTTMEAFKGGDSD